MLTMKLPENLRNQIQKNAGVLVSEFNPENWTVDRSAIMAATSGGLTIKDNTTFLDFAEDIDNAKKNTKEMKEIDDRQFGISGTAVAVSLDMIELLMAAADSEEVASGITKIVPRDELEDSDFTDVWFVCDYGKNGGIAILFKNVLNTGGFSLKTTDKAKGQFAFDLTAHYSQNDNEQPFEIYVKESEA